MKSPKQMTLTTVTYWLWPIDGPMDGPRSSPGTTSSSRFMGRFAIQIHARSRAANAFSPEAMRNPHIMLAACVCVCLASVAV